MAIVDKQVEITLNPRTISHYEILGYEIPRYKDKSYNWKVKIGTKIIVNVCDLNKGNHTEINIRCDYCGKLFKRKYCDYVNQYNSSNINKYCCINCRKDKNKEVFQNKYGVDSIFQTDEMRKHLSNIKKLDCNLIREHFKNKNLIPIFSDEDYKDCNSHLNYICSIHSSKIQWTTVASLCHADNKGCKLCCADRKRGALNSNWKGGLYKINIFLRDSITTWLKDSMKHCNYKCVITGNPFDEIHHLHNFSDIVGESLEILGIDLKKQTINYESNELEQIKDKVIELHYKYPFGVCLTKDIHKLFHSIYGRKNNTIEQFEEFKKNYERGEFQ